MTYIGLALPTFPDRIRQHAFPKARRVLGRPRQPPERRPSRDELPRAEVKRDLRRATDIQLICDNQQAASSPTGRLPQLLHELIRRRGTPKGRLPDPNKPRGPTIESLLVAGPGSKRIKSVTPVRR